MDLVAAATEDVAGMPEPAREERLKFFNRPGRRRSRWQDWINYVYIDGPWAGTRGTYNGDLKELIEYPVPDHHCPDNCQLGQD